MLLISVYKHFLQFMELNAPRILECLCITGQFSAIHRFISTWNAFKKIRSKL